MALYCGKCGASLNSNDKRCPYCGAAIENASVNSSPNRKPPKKKSSLIVLSVLLVLCMISAVAVTLAVRNNKFDNVVSNIKEDVEALKPTPEAPEVDVLMNQQFGESCQCGETAYWKLSADGKTLLIYGTGELYSENLLEENNRQLSYNEQSNIKYVVVDEGIEKLSYHNFGFWKLDCLYLPATLQEINNSFYIFADISQIKLNTSNRYFVMKDDVLFSSDMTKLVKYPSAIKASSYETPQSVKLICCDAFCQNNHLKRLTISSSTEAIGEGTFAKMENLRDITIPDSVTEIGDSALFSCEKLENVTLSSGIETIPEGMFNGCTSLKNIVIPEGVDYISTFAFDGCESLEKVVLPSTIRTLGALSFRDCTSLKEINLPEGLKYLGSNGAVFENDKGKVFENCTSIKEIVIPASIEEIRWGVFSGWTENQTIYMRAMAPGREWKEEWAEKCAANIVWGYSG